MLSPQPPIPCTSIDPTELASVEALIARRREKLLWTWCLVSLLLLTTAAWLANAFVYYPALRAERFELLNRDRRESEGDPDSAYIGTPLQANKIVALIAGVIMAGLTTAAVVFTVRNRMTPIKHDPGPVEQSVRPDYSRPQTNVLNPPSITMYFIRCRGCGKTLRQWEQRTK